MYEQEEATELGERIYRLTMENALDAGSQSDHSAIAATMAVQNALGSMVDRLLEVPEMGGQRNLVLHYLAGRVNR